MVKLKSSLRTFMVTTLNWLTVTEYLCHKWPQICSVCRNHNSVLSSFMIYHRVYNKSNMTDATSGTGTYYLSRAPELTPLPFFSGDLVVQFLVFCVVCCWSLSCCPLGFSHCIVCPSSTCGFWIPLWHLQSCSYKR